MTTETTNEMGLGDLTYSGAPEMSIELPMADAPPVELEKEEDVHGQGIDPESVYVYASTINPASSMGEGNIVAFDVTFNVSCTSPDTGTVSTYTVIKRIGVDKMKMAHEAKSNNPISIVEAKKPESYLTNTQRLKALAGLK